MSNQLAVGHITAERITTSIVGSDGPDFSIKVNDVSAFTSSDSSIVCHLPVEVDRLTCASTLHLDAAGGLHIGAEDANLDLGNTSIVLGANRNVVSSGIVVYGAPGSVPTGFDPSTYKRAFEWHASNKDLFHEDADGNIVVSSAPERPQWTLSGGDLNLRGFTDDGRACSFQLAVENHMLCVYYNVDDGSGNIVRQLITSFAGLPIVDASSPIGTPVPGNHVYNNDFYLVINTNGSVSWRNSAGVVPLLNSSGRIAVDTASIGSLTATNVVAETLVGYIGTSNLVGTVQNHQIESMSVAKLTGVMTAAQLPTTFESLAIDALTCGSVAATTVTATTVEGALATSNLSGKVADSQLDTVACSRLTGTINAYRLPSVINPVTVSGAVTATQFSGPIAASNVTGLIADSQISAVSASKVTGTLAASNLPATIAGTTVSGDLTVAGNLTVSGTQTVTNSEVTVLSGSNLKITNIGDDTALAIDQQGTGPMLTVNSNVVYVGNSGYVGVGTATPASRLHVAGDVTCTNVLGSVAASSVTSGTLDSARVPTTLRGTTFTSATSVQGALSALTLAGDIDASSLVSGTVNAARLPSTMNSTSFSGNVTVNGTVAATSVSGSVAASQVTGLVAASQIAGIAASQVTGLVAASQIAGIAASQVTGLVAASQIAGIAASQVTGLVAASQIAGIATSQLTGTLSASHVGNSLVFQGTSGDSQGFHTFIAERVYGGTEQSEMLIFKGNDAATANGPDRIRMLAANILLQTYSATLPTTGNTVESIGTTSANVTTAVIVDHTGRVGIGMTSPSQALDVTGNVRASGSFMGSLAASNITGTLAASQVAGIAASQITGTLAASQLAGIAASQITGTLAASQVAGIAASQITGTLAASQLAGIAASQITGTLAASQLAGIAASQITGTLAASQLAGIAASQITGTLAASQVAGIAASQITGTLAASQIPASLGATTFTGSVGVTGSVTATGDIVAYGNVSDRRFKTDIQPYTGDLTGLDPVTWTWGPNAPIDSARIGTSEIGLIAQDVPADFRYTAEVNGETVFAVRYDKVVVPLINAVRDLQARVAALEQFYSQ